LNSRATRNALIRDEVLLVASSKLLSLDQLGQSAGQSPNESPLKPRPIGLTPCLAPRKPRALSRVSYIKPVSGPRVGGGDFEIGTRLINPNAAGNVTAAGTTRREPGSNPDLEPSRGPTRRGLETTLFRLFRVVASARKHHTANIHSASQLRRAIRASRIRTRSSRNSSRSFRLRHGVASRLRCGDSADASISAASGGAEFAETRTIRARKERLVAGNRCRPITLIQFPRASSSSSLAARNN